MIFIFYFLECVCGVSGLSYVPLWFEVFWSFLDKYSCHARILSEASQVKSND